MRHQSLASFSPILLSSIISYVITTKFFDYEPAFEISSIEVNSLSQIIIVISGLIVEFCKPILLSNIKKINFLIFGSRPISYPDMQIICAVVSIKFPEVTGIGADVVKC